VQRFCDGLAPSTRILWAPCDPLLTLRPLGPEVTRHDRMQSRPGGFVLTSVALSCGGVVGQRAACAVFAHAIRPLRVRAAPAIEAVGDACWVTLPLGD
jgi:hypothetical protein